MLDQRSAIRSYPYVRRLTVRPAPAALFGRPLQSRRMDMDLDGFDAAGASMCA
jgi:hypothetical protein